MLAAWYRMHQRRLMLRRIVGLAPTHNVYVNLGLRRPTCPPGRAWRGKCADVSAIPGLWVDMDHAGGVHTTADLPSREELLGFLQAMPFAWSLLIDTTGGAHGYVLFRELWLFDVPEDPIRYNPSDIEEAPWLLQAPQASILRPEPEDDAPAA
jgi:hypothetical protein